MASVPLKANEVSFGPSPATRAEDASGAANWLLCRTGLHRFALPMSDVIETMRMLPVEAIADAPRLVRGVCVIRGAPVAVVDSALLFDDQPADYERLITVRTGKRTIAFAAEAVLGIQALPPSTMEQSHPLFRDIDAIAAIVALDEELVFFLRTALVVPDDFVVNANINEARV